MNKNLFFVGLVFVVFVFAFLWLWQNQYYYHTQKFGETRWVMIVRVDKFSGRTEKQVFDMVGEQRLQLSGVWVPATHDYKFKKISQGLKLDKEEAERIRQKLGIN